MPDAPAPETLDPSQQKLKMREKFSYGFGDFASCLYWQTVSVYLAIFYTDIFGISALAAGTTARTLDRVLPGLPRDRHPRDLSEGQRLALALAVVVAPSPTGDGG